MCVIEHDPTAQIIHGYHGRIFKDYIYSSEFLIDMNEEGFQILKMDGSKNPGSTDLTLDI
jgi:hypothetical protein